MYKLQTHDFVFFVSFYSFLNQYIYIKEVHATITTMLEVDEDGENASLAPAVGRTSLAQTSLGVTKDLVTLSSSISQRGHQWAHMGADYSFKSWACVLESAKATLEGQDLGDSAVGKTVCLLQSFNSAAFAVAKAGISLSEKVVEHTHAAAGSRLHSVGAKDGTLMQLLARRLVPNEEASKAVLALLDFLYEFLRDCEISLQSLPRALMIIAKLHHMCSVVGTSM